MNQTINENSVEYMKNATSPSRRRSRDTSRTFCVLLCDACNYSSCFSFKYTPVIALIHVHTILDDLVFFFVYMWLDGNDFAILNIFKHEIMLPTILKSIRINCFIVKSVVSDQGHRVFILHNTNVNQIGQARNNESPKR